MRRTEPPTLPANAHERKHTVRLRRALAAVRLVLIAVGIGAAILALDLNIRTIQENGPGLARAAEPLANLPFLGITITAETMPRTLRQAELARLRAAEIGWVRQRLDWAQVEPEPGRYTWHQTDALVDDILAAGLTPMLVLDGSPAWARAVRDRQPEDNRLAPPDDPATFAAFAAAVAARYGDRVDFYQLWDEPNIAPHWGDRHIEPVHYAQLLRAGAAAIRAEDPHAVIVAAALAPTNDRGHTAVDEVYFLRRMLAAGAGTAMDAVAAQPFGFGHPALDGRRRMNVLNYQRVALIRRTLVAAGEADIPVVVARFGWNDAPNSPWRTVLEPMRSEFAGEAVTTARTAWPWLVAAAWAVNVPAAPRQDPIWGFAADDSLLAVLQSGAATPPSIQPRFPNRAAWLWIALILVSVAIAGLRGADAWRMLPWRQWRDGLRRTPVLLFALWGVLAASYFAVTWPPLVLLCLAVAAALAAVQPINAVWLAVLLLPFHIYHKELHFASGTIYLPPTQAVLLAALPALVATAWSDARARRLPRVHPFDRMAAGWLLLGAVTAVNVWHWPAYGQGSVDLVLAPLLIFAMARVWAQRTRDQVVTGAMLFAGGGLAAALGLSEWLHGAGTLADELRRLVGPHFSPNHTALYLERTLFLGTALAVGLRHVQGGRGRAAAGLAALATVTVGVTLLLTASRGALALAVPAGAAVLLWLTAPRRWLTRRQGTALLFVGLALAASMVWMMLPRAANTATIIERVLIWRATVELWLAQPMFGVGAGGFFWSFPAHIPTDAAIDPNLRHPHNLWLEVLSGWGVLGGVWLLWLLAGFGRAAVDVRRRLQSSRLPVWTAAGLIAGLAAGLAHGQVDAFLTLPDLAAWNWAALALLAAANAEGPPN